MNLGPHVAALASRWGVGFAQPSCLELIWLAPLIWAAAALAWRRAGPCRTAAAALLRSAAFSLLVLVLAGAGTSGVETRRATVIAAIDVSDSMGEEGRGWAAGRAVAVLEGAARGAARGVLCFADGGEVVVPPGRGGCRGPFAWSVPAGRTDLGDAIALARLSFPREGPRRLLLFSDGNETDGDAFAAAQDAACDGVRIDCFSPPVSAPAPAAVTKIDLPARTSRSEKFTARILAVNRSEKAVGGTLSVTDGSRTVVREMGVTLRPGTNDYEFDYRIAAPGFHRIGATLKTSEGIASSCAASLLVAGPSRALCVSGTPGGARFVAEALAGNGFEVRAGAPTALPRTMEGLRRYDCVVLSDVPPASVGPERMEMLERYVRDYGGGLVLLGDDRVFGPEGYGGTPIEKAMPVRMGKAAPVARLKEARFCVMLVIDTSGSMRQGRKIESAAEAAERVVMSLGPDDMAGVTVFDFGYELLVPLQPVRGRKGEIAARVRAIGAGGGTLMSAPLEDALDQMRAARAKKKHVVLLTDGITADQKSYDYDHLAGLYRGARVTLSTIGVGGKTNAALLKKLARTTLGRYYKLSGGGGLALTMLRDVEAAVGKSTRIDGETVPRLGGEGAREMLKGIAQEDLPKLGGYSVVEAKGGAAVALVAGTRGAEDPLLAGWRYGLGRAAAYASDAEARWSGEMVGWDKFGKFWAQIARWTARRESASRYRAAARSGKGAPTLSVETLDAPAPGASYRVELPGGAGREPARAALVRAGPRVYEAALPAGTPAPEWIAVERVENGMATDRAEVPVSDEAKAPEASAETASRGCNQGLLEEIAGASGGLVNPDPASLSFPPARVPVKRSASARLVPCVFALLLADIALRKLSFRRGARR